MQRRELTTHCGGVRRRNFLVLLGSTTAIAPVIARAQGQPIRLIGVLAGNTAVNAKERHDVFELELQRLGWKNGAILRIESRWSGGNLAQTHKHAKELVELAPDLIAAFGSVSVGPLLEATQSLPIVFAIVADPVGAGFVEKLSRPGGNATGFMLYDYSLAGKWLELLKEVAPHVKHAAVLRDSALPASIGQFAVIQAMARSVGVEVSAIGLRDTGEIERGIAALARGPESGIIATTSALSIVHHDLIIRLAGRYSLPAVYNERLYPAAGGLISYGPNVENEYRRAAGYVDRVLRGEKTADLPVQSPTKYDLVINLKTAKVLGIEVPATLLARADEVIE